MESFNIWEDAKLNNKLWRRDGMKSLLRKYKGAIDEDALSFGEDILFKMTKSEYDDALTEYAEEERQRAQRQKRADADMKAFEQRKREEAEAEQKKQKEVEAERKRQAAAANPPMMKRDNSYGAKVAEKIATSPAAHTLAVAAQRASNSLINPVGLSLRLHNWGQDRGVNTGIERVEAKNNYERGLEAATGAAYGSLFGSAVGGALATTKAVTKAAMSANKFKRGAAKAFQYVALPGAEGAQIGASAGGAALPAMVNLKEPDKNVSAYEKAKHMAANFGLGVLGSAVTGGLGGAAHHVLNQSAINRGIKNLKTGLATQKYEDVKLGEFSRKALAELNEIRYQEGVPLMRNNNLMVPAGQVKHIYEERIVGNKVDADSLADGVKEIMRSQKVRVRKGNVTDNQELSVLRKGKKTAYFGYVSVGRDSKKNILLTTMKKDAKRAGK